MKRTCKNNINRNRSVFSHMRNNNIVTPEILMNQIWMEEEQTNGVKIIELNSSSDSSRHSNSPWSYRNDKFDEQNNHTIKEEARRRRRMQTDNENFAEVYANLFDPSMQSTNTFYAASDTEFMDTTPINRHMNCFTIIDNHLKSQSSTDSNYEGVEVIELDKTDEVNWDHVYNDEMVTYESGIPPEKRTIWIYSYKNKRLLSENDYELVNIPGKDASSGSTLCSTSDEDLKVDKEFTPMRLGSPIPTTYIPKLNLSLVQTLSTVTEISETDKFCSKDSSEEINIIPKNNWLTERNDKVKKTVNSNVVNWMALSPRERRRRSFNTSFEISNLQNIKETEITYAEGNDKIQKISNRSKPESPAVEVQVDVHSNVNEIKNEVESPKHKPNQNKKIADIIPMKISYADADNEIEDGVSVLDYSNKPSIQISAKRVRKITDPIENLECNDWIDGEKKKKVLYDFGFDKNCDTEIEVSPDVADSANRRLWLRNMKLMKPPQWSEYLPITCSPPSLHISMSLSSLNGKKSWFKRLTKCIKCCK